MKNRRFLLLCSFLSNMLIFVMAAAAVGRSYKAHASGALSSSGVTTFRYFTTDSNILAGAFALIAGVFGLFALLKKRDRIPEAAVLLKYIGTCAVSLTFTVVIVFLGPIYGYGSMYTGASFYMHGIVPMLSMISFIAFDRGYRLPKSRVLFGLIPTVIYGTVYFTMVVLIGKEKGGWPDFYAFTRGGFWWLSLILCFGGSAVLCILLRLLHNRCEKRPGEGEKLNEKGK